MTALIKEIGETLSEFRHLKINRLLVSATLSRTEENHGLLAYVLPMKYREGSPVERRIRGRRAYHYAMLPLFHEGEEILYIVYFLLPRFLNLGFQDKLETVIHELYHISPEFNGDLRRFKGRRSIHGKSLKEYDLKIKALTEAFLSSHHCPHSYDFLKFNRQEAELKFGKIVAPHIREPRPKLLKVSIKDVPKLKAV